jgi:hypothetical protein
MKDVQDWRMLVLRRGWDRSRRQLREAVECVRLLLAYTRAVRIDRERQSLLSEMLVANAYAALPDWMRKEIEK